MEKALFSISCTTCRARLAVRNKEAIGEILECPKCGSMVLISPPEGWVPREEPPPTPPKGSPAKDSSVEKQPIPGKNGDSAVRRNVPVTRETASGKPAVEPPPVQLPASVHVEVVPPPAASDSAIGRTGSQPVSKGQGATVPVAPEAVPAAPAPAAAMVPAGFTPFELPEVVAGETFLSALTRSLWGRVAVLVVSGLLGLAGVVAVWAVVSNRHADPTPNPEIAEPEIPAPPPAGGKPTSSVAQSNRRWLPEQTLLLIDLRLSRLPKQSLDQPSVLTSLAVLGPWWQPSSEKLLTGLELGPEQVRRLTWASTNLADCAASCVVVLELEEGIDASRQLPKGENIDLGANLVARQPRNNSWPHPLLAVDAHTVVTGSKEALRQLVGRNGDAELTNPRMELLLKKLSPGGDLAVLVDLSSARSAGWKLPANWLAPARWLDVWPSGKARWRLLCDTPLALGLSVQAADQRRCDLGLVCDGEKTVEKVRSAVETLVPDAIQALPARISALKSVPPPDKFSIKVADQYKQLLDDLLAALRTVPAPDTGDGIVWVRFGWGGRGLLVSAATALESSSALQTDWFAAARSVDESNHRGLLSGLLSYVKTQNPPRFPPGVAGGGGLLEPETRLSWIAGLLPYLGHADWHVDSAYSWNSAQNNPVTKLALPEVVNPAFGPAASPDHYPVTHYVGLAGVGENAAQLKDDDPHAGVFGYGRQTRQQDLARGGANTIAVLGVQDQCGPWAQGGRATVRSLTRQPYINGPDGFGSGQADGMVVGYADGHAGFLSKNIDPHVMEQLASVHSGDQVDMAAIEPTPPAAPKLPEANAKPQAVANHKPPAVDPKPPVVLDPKLQAMLNLPIAKMSLPNMPLANALQTISAIGNLPVSFDPDAMEELGVSLHDPISIEIAKATVGKTLEEIAAKRSMASVVDNGQVLLTSTAEHREGLRPVRYEVSDLTGGEAQAAADLAALVQRLVVPESWQIHGGRGIVEVAPGLLRVTQSGHVHYQILVFCEKLRIARGLPPKSSLDPKKFVLTTRTARARAILDEMVSVRAGGPSSLVGILDQWKPPGGEILLDRPALAVIGISESAASKFKADKLPLGEALQKLLEPLGLAWRAVDAATLQVTTQKAAAARLELEFYPVGKLPAGQSPAALIERIKAGLPGAAWGEGGQGGVIYFDPPSQCLIVLQLQPLQRTLEALLNGRAR